MKQKNDLVAGLKGKLTGGDKGKITGGAKGKLDGGPKSKDTNSNKLFETITNPLSALTLTDDLEQDAANEAALMKQTLRDADKRIADASLLKNDSEYFFVVAFESREQKEIFLKAAGWILLGDKYVDGTALARKMEIPLPIVHFPPENINQRKVFTDLVDPDLT
jgi:hypothetical protein